MSTTQWLHLDDPQPVPFIGSRDVVDAPFGDWQSRLLVTDLTARPLAEVAFSGSQGSGTRSMGPLSRFSFALSAWAELLSEKSLERNRQKKTKEALFEFQITGKETPKAPIPTREAPGKAEDKTPKLIIESSESVKGREDQVRQALEKRLDALTKELEELRRELSKPR